MFKNLYIHFQVKHNEEVVERQKAERQGHK